MTRLLPRRLAVVTALLLPLGLASGVATASTAPKRLPTPVYLSADFASGPAGFTANGRPAGWRADGGGYVYGTPDDNASVLVESTPAWRGDRSNAVPGVLAVTVEVVDDSAAAGATESVDLVFHSSFRGYEMRHYESVPIGEVETLRVLIGSEYTWEDTIINGYLSAAGQRDVLRRLDRLEISSSTMADGGELRVHDVSVHSRFARRAEIRRTARAVAGQVRTARPRCRAGVLVEVSRSTDRGAELVARVTTGARGGWQVRRALGPGRYEARVARELVPGLGECAGAVTQPVRRR